MTPGPGKVFVRPGERHKIRESGLVMPSVVQDDADYGEVIAVGAGAWFGHLDGAAGLVAEPAPGRAGEEFEPVKRIMPVAVGDTVFYDCQNVVAVPLGFSAASDVVYVLEVRDILGVGAHA
jgi:co-chaperonin GroES (HSP10)